MTPYAIHAAAVRQSLSLDPQRPRYHFLPPHQWMNDPNGLCLWRGQYHLFYQHNPTGALWGNIHWGHAVSADLVHWRDLPLALTPSPGGPDKDGCWSGVLVDHDGTPTLLYTGVYPEVQCLATGSDDLITWDKRQEPALAAPPADLDVLGFRDPCVWQAPDGLWYMTIGTGIVNAGGAVLLYRSPDLRQWEYVGPLIACEDDRHGVMWECPAFFPLGDKWVLLISVWPRLRTHYFVGTFDGQRFTPEYDAPLDHGAHFFAPQTLLDPAGRRLMIGWIWEGRSNEAQEAAGWSGLQSIPRVLSLRPDRSLGFEPLPAFEALRGEAVTVTDIALGPDAPYPLPVRGDCLEIRAGITPASTGAVSLSLRRSPDGSEQTTITYDAAAGTLSVDPSRASLSPDALPVTCSAPLTLDAGEALRLTVFVDRSVIEIYANERLCLTSRIYPTRPDSLGLQIEARGGTASLIDCTVWEMRSIWS